MEIRRYLLSEIPIEDIESLIKDSFFASPGFLNLWSVRGGVAVWWTVSVGGSIVAVLPGVEFGRGPYRRFYSTPNGCYGRLCYATGLEEDAGGDIARNIMRALANAGYMKVFVSDFYNCFEAEGEAETLKCETRLINISDPDWSPPHRKLRQDIARAEREGVILERFDVEKHFVGFTSLVKISERRIGVKQKYSHDFFRALEKLSREDDRVRWVYCEHVGKPMTSSIFVVEGDNLLYWQVYFDESLSHLQATKYAIYTVAREFAERGVQYLNMGGSPDQVPSVNSFKGKWGGEIYRYHCHHMKSLLGRMI